MTVMVVDDDKAIRQLVAAIVEDLGFDAVQASSGEDAIDYMVGCEVYPQLVILDIEMPGMDGYETAALMKGIVGDRKYLPVIFLSGSTANDVLTRCLEVGEDYIAKPFTIDMVTAKLKANMRVAELYSQLDRQYEEVKRYRHTIEIEHEIVERIFANHVRRHLVQRKNLRVHISPKSIFNGDVLLTAVGPFNNLYVAVGDVTGHGLPAAVGALPVYSSFRTMADKGLGVGTVAAEMNRKLAELMPDNMLLALAIFEINASATEMTVWSGGMPSMILADKHGFIKDLIRSTHCPLAMLSAEEFRSDVEVHKLTHGDRVYLFTDGVEESINAQREMFGEARLHGLFDGAHADMFWHIIGELQAFNIGTDQDDDITLVEVISAAPEDFADLPVAEPVVRGIPWSLQIQLGAEELRCIDPIPQISRLLAGVTGLQFHQDYIATILSELYSNALEHGLLKLDSSLKKNEDGFVAYYQQRKKRLSELNEGEIVIDLRYGRSDGGMQVTIRVKDSGAGYDYKKKRESGQEDAFGRGVGIVSTLCSSVTYSDRGTCVTAIYDLAARPGIPG